MLPGIRFLLAAIALTVSLVVFGLGAAALLRSAHQEFASIPTRPAPPETIFAQQADTPPTLAILRVDTPAPDAPAPIASSTEPATALTPPDADKPTTTEAVASLSKPPEVPAVSPVEPAQPATAQSEPPKAEAAPEPVIAVAVAPTTEPEATPTSATPTSPPADIPVATAAPEAPAPEPATTLTEDDAKLTSSKIATLGGPPVDTQPVPLPVTRPTVQPAKKVEKKRVVAKKRRVASRAVAPAAPQQLDPFGQPITR